MYTYSIIVMICHMVSGLSENDNVGTVLFTEADYYRKCWDDEQLAILSSRMFFEDLLPNEDHFDIQNDKFILTLIEYFKMTINSVKSSVDGKTKHLLLNSLSDSLGGYLHKKALPLARHAFYSGNVDYEAVARLHAIYEELKAFLRTNGENWAPPMTEFAKFKNNIEPIQMVTDAAGQKPCESLIFEEHPNNKHVMQIPIPFFDDVVEPETIAIPLRNNTLKDVQAKDAAFIVVKYFVTAVGCLAARKADKESVASFYEKMNLFLVNQIFVHLNDEKFYAAFGGVYRIQKSIDILATINEHRTNEKICRHADFEEPSIADSKRFSGRKNRDNEIKIAEITTLDTKYSKSFIVIIVFLSILLLWLLIGICYLCFRVIRFRAEQGYCGISPCSEQKWNCARCVSCTSTTDLSSATRMNECQPMPNCYSSNRCPPTRACASNMNILRTQCVQTGKKSLLSLCGDTSCDQAKPTTSILAKESCGQKRSFRNVRSLSKVFRKRNKRCYPSPSSNCSCRSPVAIRTKDKYCDPIIYNADTSPERQTQDNHSDTSPSSNTSD